MIDMKIHEKINDMSNNRLLLYQGWLFVCSSSITSITPSACHWSFKMKNQFEFHHGTFCSNISFPTGVYESPLDGRIHPRNGRTSN
jgi:hypothetical protein